MPQLTSPDRTSIAYQQTGHGPAVVLLDGGEASPLAPAAVQVARGIPGARHQSLDDQPHNVDDAVMAAALTEFFG